MRTGSHHTRGADLSVIVLVPDRYETVRMTVGYLRAQTVREQIELVIVAPSMKELELDAAELRGFPQVRVMEVGPIRSPGAARAAGVRQAGASIVAFAEDHSYPAPGWAAALIQAHRQPWAAVGPVMVNANPATAISWANLFLGFGPWIEPVEPAQPGLAEGLPWHNTSYKRAVLLDFGPELEAMLEVEGILQQELRIRGYELYLEPKAKTHHLNITRPSSYVKEQFYGGRCFAAARRRRWSWPQRMLYTCGAPLIFLTRLMRVLQEIRKSGRQRDLLPRVLPALVLGLASHAMGEMTGYAFGAGDAPRQFSEFEFHKWRHIAEPDGKPDIQG